MSDPRRLLEIDAGDTQGNTCEAALLRSANVDVPSAAARRRTGLALGIAAGTVATLAVPSSMAASTILAPAATPGAAASASAVTGVAAASGGAAKAGAAMLLLKWAGVGVVSGALALGAIHYAAPSTLRSPPFLSSKRVVPLATPAAVVAARDPKTEPEAAPLDAVVESSGLSALGADPGPDPRPDPGDRVRGPVHDRAPAARPHPVSTPTPPPDMIPDNGRGTPASRSLRLADEVALLDQARSAVAAGQIDEALHVLNRHDHEFAGGPLAPEADVVRIEALAIQGSDDAAARAATKFLAANPASPQTQHVRSILHTILERRTSP